jgi:hypothetical protein
MAPPSASPARRCPVQSGDTQSRIASFSLPAAAMTAPRCCTKRMSSSDSRTRASLRRYTPSGNRLPRRRPMPGRAGQAVEAGLREWFKKLDWHDVGGIRCECCGEENLIGEPLRSGDDVHDASLCEP